MSEPSFRAYLATALTGLREEERNEIFRCSDEISRISGQLGISLHLVVTEPAAGLWHRPRYYCNPQLNLFGRR